MKGKTCLVTGGSRGIGLETARGLAELGATVVITGRGEEHTSAAAADIRDSTGNGSVSFVVADFLSLDGVRELAQTMESRHESLHVLVNNAGVWFPRYTLSGDGFEATLAVNHLAPFLLTHLLLPMLRRSAPARVINVSSRLHRKARPKDLFREGKPRFFRGLKTYGQTKLAMQLFSLELSRRLRGTRVTVNSLHPGDVATDITRENPLIYLGARLGKSMLMTPAQGAMTSIHVASAAELETVSGAHFRDSTQIAPSKYALDEAAARRLWAMTCSMTGVADSADDLAEGPG
jgi:NAD(P)-dependent dehydrogenase (short-subunit alcohol dehydrogenase family)